MDKQKIFFYLESQKEFLAGVSDSVWDTPETCYEENVSAETVCRALEEAGFTVERNVAGISTAFMGTYGHGKPVIGFLGEFDALSGLSQTAGIAEKCPLVPGGNGHGCGHNLLGAGCLAGAMGKNTWKRQERKERLFFTDVRRKKADPERRLWQERAALTFWMQPWHGTRDVHMAPLAEEC
mgnify:CR=1 FL=1